MEFPHIPERLCCFSGTIIQLSGYTAQELLTNKKVASYPTTNHRAGFEPAALSVVLKTETLYQLSYLWEEKDFPIRELNPDRRLERAISFTIRPMGRKKVCQNYILRKESSHSDKSVKTIFFEKPKSSRTERLDLNQLSASVFNKHACQSFRKKGFPHPGIEPGPMP